jgi:lipid-A-disaccharide synthase
MVNIVLGERVVPELIQNDFNPESVLPLLDELIQPGPRRQAVLAAFAKLPEILGGGGASKKAAEVVAGFFQP